MPPLSKNRESILRTLLSKHGRKKSDLCLVEGKKACAELMSLRPEIAKFAVVSDSFTGNYPQNIQLFQVSTAKFAELSSFKNAEGILIVAKRPDFSKSVSQINNFCILLDKISDPGNLGTMIRTARAVGLKNLWITEGTVDVFSPKVIRCALGAQFAVEFTEFLNVADAICEFRKHSNGNIYFTDPHQGANCFTEEKLFDKSLIVFGNEAHGISDYYEQKCVSIPMPGGAESLNVAQAFTIIVFESVRRKIIRETN